MANAAGPPSPTDIRSSACSTQTPQPEAAPDPDNDPEIRTIVECIRAPPESYPIHQAAPCPAHPSSDNNKSRFSEHLGPQGQPPCPHSTADEPAASPFPPDDPLPRHPPVEADRREVESPSDFTAPSPALPR